METLPCSSFVIVKTSNIFPLNSLLIMSKTYRCYSSRFTYTLVTINHYLFRLRNGDCQQERTREKHADISVPTKKRTTKSCKIKERTAKARKTKARTTKRRWAIVRWTKAIPHGRLFDFKVRCNLKKVEINRNKS